MSKIDLVLRLNIMFDLRVRDCRRTEHGMFVDMGKIVAEPESFVPDDDVYHYLLLYPLQLRLN